MKRMYESKNKLEFMKTINNQNWYEWLFDKTFDYEHRFSKDLFDFNKEELLEFLKDRKMSFSTLNVNKGFISMYINWAISRGLKFNKRNIAQEITKDDLQKISVNHEGIHVDTIYEIIRFPGVESSLPPLKNYQDRLLVYLLFLGIRGDRAKELTNLKFDHIDFDNKILRLSEIDSERSDMKLDDFCISLFLNTRNEKYYERYMDVSYDNATNTREDYELIESDYVFRKVTATKNPKDTKISYQGILRRLKTISNYVGETLKMKTIERAGMTYIGKKVLDNGLELSLNNPVVIKSIFERYNINGEVARGNVLRRIKKDIQEVYGEES